MMRKNHNYGPEAMRPLWLEGRRHVEAVLAIKQRYERDMEREALRHMAAEEAALPAAMMAVERARPNPIDWDRVIASTQNKEGEK